MITGCCRGTATHWSLPAQADAADKRLPLGGKPSTSPGESSRCGTLSWPHLSAWAQGKLSCSLECVPSGSFGLLYILMAPLT